MSYNSSIVGSITVLIVCILIFVICLTIYLKRRKRYDVSKITISNIDQMNGFEFEQYLYVLFAAIGYEDVFLMKRSRDFGADLLIVTNQNEKIVIQAKRLTNTLGLAAVQEVYGAKAYYKAEKAMIITSTEQVSSSCQQLAAATGVQIVSRGEFCEWIALFKKNAHTEIQQMIERKTEPIHFKRAYNFEKITPSRNMIKAGSYYYRR